MLSNIKIIGDFHTHTIASSHAYSTLLENVQYAKDNGMEVLAITDHGPDMEEGPHVWHFQNEMIFPRNINDVKVFNGIEANILDKNGHLDFDVDNNLLQKLDVVIASIHGPCYNEILNSDHTKTYLNVIKNNYVDILGHIDRYNLNFNIDEVISFAKEKNKIIELNEGSFSYNSDNKKIIAILECCKKYKVDVLVNSDAHFAMLIGKFDKSIDLLNKINFPKELILNEEANKNRMLDFINRKNIVRKFDFS